jgi:hypothetical protein
MDTLLAEAVKVVGEQKQLVGVDQAVAVVLVFSLVLGVQEILEQMDMAHIMVMMDSLEHCCVAVLAVHLLNMVLP